MVFAATDLLGRQRQRRPDNRENQQGAERFLAAHMKQSSTMMAGGSIDISLDEGQGRQVGSHIRMRGRALGLPLALDEVVIEHAPSFRKVWESVGAPRLWVRGSYRMGVDLSRQGSGCTVSVCIDYNFPSSPVLRWRARWISRSRAAWCVEQMVAAARE